MEKIKTRIQDVVLIGTGFVSAIIVMYAAKVYIEDKRQEENMQRAKLAYSELLVLADKDKNNNLSDLERLLLIERINSNKGNIAGTTFPEYDWKELQEPTAWDRYRLEKTLERYKNEAPGGI